MARPFCCLCLFAPLFFWAAGLTGCGGALPRPPGLSEPPSATARAGRDADSLPRANPGYVQWLERQSLLRRATELTAIVTGSSLPWNAPSTRINPDSLLERAHLWLDFTPLRTVWDSDAPVLRQVTDHNLPGLWAGAGIQGLFLTGAAESGAAWDAARDAEDRFAEPGGDSVSFEFAPAVGDDGAYAVLEEHALKAGLLLGGEIPPAAIGLGPDFFLAARGVRDYPGLFLMVELPAEVWPLLPDPPSDAAGQPLPPGVTAELARRALIPPAFAQDVTPLPGRAGGWAATAEIMGVDGVTRRWIYRYAGTPGRPVLNWDDPSGAARRVLAAGIIRQAGLLHQPLVGLSVEALWGQDPSGMDRDGRLTGDSPEPALSALRALSRDVRRYGAWSVLLDRMPIDLVPALQAAGVDFTADTTLSPALEYALLSGHAEPLAKAIDSALAAGVDQARLWRHSADGTALPPAPEGLPDMALPAEWRELLCDPEGRPRATAPTLAAVAAGLTPSQIRSFGRAGGGGAWNMDDERRQLMKKIQAAHMLQLAFRALQPGLLAVSGSDLAGALFAPEKSRMPAVWAPGNARQRSTRQGLPAAVQLYPPLADQMREEDSPALELRRLADLRRISGVAQGRLVARPGMDHPAATGVLTALPGGDYLLTAGNFSGSPLVTDVKFPPGLIRRGGPGRDLISGQGVAVSRDHLRLRMGPWQYRVVRLAPAVPDEGKTEP
ncbi:MAG: hypothetical protein J1E80_03650 [Desulfovibrionaceae bacterium]|nr:hypothetical protein [Desulfovibrionaceae bacterium]